MVHRQLGASRSSSCHTQYLAQIPTAISPRKFRQSIQLDTIPQSCLIRWRHRCGQIDARENHDTHGQSRSTWPLQRYCNTQCGPGCARGCFATRKHPQCWSSWTCDANRKCCAYSRSYQLRRTSLQGPHKFEFALRRSWSGLRSGTYSICRLRRVSWREWKDQLRASTGDRI